MPAPCRLGLFSDTLSVCFRAVCHGGRGSGGNGRGPPPRSTWFRRAAEEAPRGCARPPVRRPKSRGLGPRQRRAPSRQRPLRRAPPPASRRVLAHRARVPALQTTAHRGGGAPHPHARASTTCRGTGGASLPTSRPGRRLSRDGGGEVDVPTASLAVVPSIGPPPGGATTTHKEPASRRPSRSRRAAGGGEPGAAASCYQIRGSRRRPPPPLGGSPAHRVAAAAVGTPPHGARSTVSQGCGSPTPHPSAATQVWCVAPRVPAASSPPLPPPRFGYPLATVMHASRPEASS